MEKPINLGCLGLLVAVPLMVLGGGILVVCQWRLWALAVDADGEVVGELTGFRNFSGVAFLVGLLGTAASVWLLRRGYAVDNAIDSGSAIL